MTERRGPKRASERVMVESPPAPAIILLKGSGHVPDPGAPDDLGCVGCGWIETDVNALLIVDTRGRYWHASCAAGTLTGHGRMHETRRKAEGE